MPLHAEAWLKESKMPFHVITHKGGGFDVENADTHEVKNKEPYKTKAKAMAYSNALNAATDGGKKSGNRNNATDRQTIRAIRDLAGQIHDHTMNLEPTDSDEDEETNEPADDEEAEDMMENLGDMDAQEAFDEISKVVGGKAISKREDVNPKEGKQKYGDVKFADEKNKKYPIDTPEHIRAAWNYINKSANAGKYSADEVKQIKAKIVSAWKDKIDKAGPPSADGKSLDLSYVKSLGLSIALKDLAVKYVGRDEIKGYTFLWGNPNTKLTDVEIEYFTKSSNFWDEQLGKSPRPLTWDHAQDFKDASPLIGTINEWGDDDLGRWYTAHMDRAHRYRKMIDKLIENGVIGTSSDSAPQYVVRERTGKATWLKEWPWFASALTDVPCEPRMIGNVGFKSLGIQLPDAPSAWEWETAGLEVSRSYLYLGDQPK